MKRRLWTAIFLTLAGGLTLRFFAPVPEWLRDASGGAAYVILASLLLRTIGLAEGLAIVGGLAWTCLVECLQAWPALDAVRRTLPGRLVLGTTFSWLDFPPYFAGAALAWPILRWTSGSAPAPGAHSIRK